MMRLSVLAYFLLSALVATFWACSNDDSSRDPVRPVDPDIIEPDTTNTDTTKKDTTHTDTTQTDTLKTDTLPEPSPVFIQNENEYTGFYKEDGYFRLQPANSAFAPILVDHVEIRGVD